MTGLKDGIDRLRPGPTAGASELILRLFHPSGNADLALSHQLASVLYLRGRHGLSAEIEESVLALKLSWRYTRSELVSMYAAVADFGRG